MTGTEFAGEHKAAAGYLDAAANGHGEEKALLVHWALQRVRAQCPRVVEIGPGGGSAVSFLASRLASEQERHKNISLTLIEAPGVSSASLKQAMAEFSKVGSCEFVSGFAQDIGTIVSEPADVISASALLHEVYSYSGGYSGLQSLIRALPGVLKPEGLFAYRDVYAVEGSSLHERAVQTYDSKPWIQFLRMFLPSYLREGTHPYHGAADEVLVRQDSRIVPMESLDEETYAFVSAPVGIFREVQRHYLTFRDHIWRSGVLGFRPVLDGQLSSDWIDAKSGHKRVHYSITGADWLPASQKKTLLMLSERYADHYTVDGDIFDEFTDIALSMFLGLTEEGASECADVRDHWMVREGRETYAYLTADELLTAFAVSSVEAPQGGRSVLMPIRVSDVLQRDRSYYNRYLRKKLPNPLKDAKQLVLFSNISLTDSYSLESAMNSLQRWCSKAGLARVYSALNGGGRYGE
ncbi:methyltransferase domain-containing protein [Streptomyces celluloflavus]|uniref:hypothetical protein n=1 Tax=Streptomyces celluloflavus TaxID=58344 RepID=UPI00369C2788